ncbi:RNA 2',3'-cyclic phosphodiesterase [candidate division WOR-3 bacterium JGI_Cruoil_03_51_56]|uniref:RNA 2',3'-cyclic phosphodiesterase n=1 Tax=candidate division WOR-3 bacterium JGI_Cruoil_03_51_56 TaxID=1973747 RepID=A0A235BQX8_UNCW3|nr:MAG: RNA 2',3'-cyclic phosphodiesterase [candidate division WOR-3 bacterium JGI_Cruoil_03_51_56]
MRCFIAVDISATALNQIKGLLVKLGKAGVAGVRWVKPFRMHLTLAFLGEVSLDFVTSVKECLPRAVAGFGPFSCRLNGIGAFPSRHRARVVWVGMDKGTDELCELQKRIAKELEKIGYRPERRPFSPHLTLGRLRFPADVTGVSEIRFQSDGFEIDRLILFQSVLKPEGPEYSRLAEFKLRS